MLNVEENFYLIRSYIFRENMLIKISLYSTIVIVFIESFRLQLPEVDLLQLVPGFYLIVLLTTFILLIVISSYFGRFPLLLDTKKGVGIKAGNRLRLFNLGRIFLVFFCFVISFSLNLTFPSSLDSFNSYGEKTLENLWSFTEVVNVELSLFIALSFISQIPLISQGFVKGQKNIKSFPRFWRFVGLISTIIGGIATPTIDGPTQLCFTFSTYLMYIFTIFIVGKRMRLNRPGSIIFGF